MGFITEEQYEARYAELVESVDKNETDSREKLALDESRAIREEQEAARRIKEQLVIRKQLLEETNKQLLEEEEAMRKQIEYRELEMRKQLLEAKYANFSNSLKSEPIASVNQIPKILKGDHFQVVSTTMLAVMPPPNQWAGIVNIKKNHMNPKITRPPFPHITLLQPFVQYRNANEATDILIEALQDLVPFRLNFTTFKLFRNATSNTLYLDPVVTPANALDNLYKTVAGIFPQVSSFKDSEKFAPHIGVGYFKKEHEAEMCRKKYQSGWQPIDFICKEIYILTRVREEPFEVRKVIPLGRDVTPSHFVEKPQ